jgi:type IV pilus assembly protein PilW
VMVALVIGLVIVGAVMMNYLGSGASATQRGQVSQMSEDAQMALLQITRDLQQAGYTEVAGVMTSGAGGTASFVRPGGGFRPVFACVGSFVDPHSAPRWSAVCDPSGAPSHALEVNFQATPANVMVNASGVPTDCIGNRLNVSATQVDESALGLSATTTYTSNRYYINRATGRPELHCASPAATTSGGMPVVDNVEDMRFWFGIVPNWNVSDPAQRQPVRFLAPDDMMAADWPRVVSVRVCVLMRTAEPVLSGDDAQVYRYRDCAGTDGIASPDRRIYRAFHTTVSLRNRSGY